MALLAKVTHFLDDPEHAAQIYGWLIDFAGLVVLAGLPTEMLGSVDLFLALLAATMRQWDDFDRHAADALALNEAMGMPRLARHRAVRDRRDPRARVTDGDAERARPLLDACIAASQRIGMPALLAQGRGRARALCSDARLPRRTRSVERALNFGRSRREGAPARSLQDIDTGPGRGTRARTDIAYGSGPRWSSWRWRSASARPHACPTPRPPPTQDPLPTGDVRRGEP